MSNFAIIHYSINSELVQDFNRNTYILIQNYMEKVIVCRQEDKGGSQQILFEQRDSQDFCK